MIDQTIVLALRGAVYWPANDYSDRQLRRVFGCGYFAFSHCEAYLRKLESLGFSVRVESDRPASRVATLVLAGPGDDPDDVCAPSGMLVDYRLPCGRIVAVDASATNGADFVDFQQADGGVVEAERLDLALEFDRDIESLEFPDRGDLDWNEAARTGWASYCAR